MELVYKIFIDPFVQMGTAPDLLVQTLWDGFVAGALYALIALGFVLIFKASGVFNFAQGIMVVFAALTLVGLHERGVPARCREPFLELRRRYSTRPGDADVKLVAELGLFDYLAKRLSICGSPAECLAQARGAKAAGANRLMLTVSLASDPVRTVELFGARVLPAL